MYSCFTEEDAEESANGISSVKASKIKTTVIIIPMKSFNDRSIDQGNDTAGHSENLRSDVHYVLSGKKRF
jgi:hypothetical protein